MKSTKRRAIRKTISNLSLLFFPVTFYYFSPVVPLAGAAGGIVSGSLLVFAALFVSAIFLGRGFCSWVCPAGALQDIAGEARDRRFSRRNGWVKYLIWIPWLVLLAILFINAGGASNIDVPFMTDNGVSVSDTASLVVYLMVALTFFLFPVLFGRRAACHTVCWMSPFMILGERLARGVRIPGIAIRRGPGTCVSCGACAATCSMDIDIDKRAAGKDPLDATSDCILCAACADACSQGALRVGSREYPKRETHLGGIEL